MHLQSTEILLRDLRFYARHGVLKQERTVGNAYTVNLTLRLSDAGAAVFEDHLDGTISYAEVYALVREEMHTPSSLLEHVAGRILRRLFETFDLLEHAVVEVCKDNPPMSAHTAGCCARLTATR